MTMKIKYVKSFLLAIFLLLLNICIQVYDLNHNISKFLDVIAVLALLGAILLAAYSLFMDFISKDDKT